MYVRTQPREIAARWIKPGDEVATYEVEDGSGDADSGRRGFCRTEEFATRFTSTEWMLVIDAPRMVRPPADEAARRPEGLVKHSAGGWWSVEPMAREFVPDEVDHVGTHALVMVPIKDNRIGPPVIVYAGEHEQFVIRERVKVDADTLDSHVPAIANRLRNHRENAEDQRTRVRVTASVNNRPGAYGHGESLIAILRADTDGHSAVGDAAALAAIGAEPDIDGPGEDTRQLPTRRIPVGVLGRPLGATDRVEDADRTVRVIAPNGVDITRHYKDED